MTSRSDSGQAHPVVGITGVRQTGMTTLARMIASRWSDPAHFFDLEDPADLARLQDPMLALREREGLIVIDEIQRIPDLSPTLRVLADRNRSPAGFLAQAVCRLGVEPEECFSGRPTPARNWTF
ncbi:MAG: AAA family ATPase [bacterium]|nr:AAA family ATPase [bacterium]